MAEEDRKVIERQAARALGLKRYFTGKPCKHGHIAERQVANGSCLECAFLRNRKFHAANPEKAYEWARRWIEKHPDERRALGRQYYRKNREKVLAGNAAWKAKNPEWFVNYHRRWKEKNRDKVRASHRNRKALKRLNGGTHNAKDVAEIMKLQGSMCACCRIKLSRDFHVDHIIPLSRGGSNDRKNLQLTCPTCNLQKSKRDPVEFMRSKGRLL